MSSTAAPRRCAALVVNPVKTDAEALAATLRRLAAASEWADPLVYETTVEDEGQAATRAALGSGADAVLVAGGDGTVRAVAEAMTGSGVPLTIVPVGTGNLLARNLALPLADPDRMVQATFDGDRHPIDVGVAVLRRADGTSGEHAFVVLGCMGLDAAMIANTSHDLKRRWGWLAYVDGAAKSLVRAEPFRVNYQVAGRRHHAAKVQSVMFANCGSLPAGLELIPGASVVDGQLDVAIVQPKTPLGWLLVWRRVAWDNSVLRRFRAGREVLRLRGSDRTVRYERGAGVDIAAAAPQAVQLDGDEFGVAVHVSCRIEHGGLMVAVPPGHVIPGEADARTGRGRRRNRGARRVRGGGDGRDSAGAVKAASTSEAAGSVRA